jgi:hypothetical protein
MSLSKVYFLNHHLENYLSKIRFPMSLYPLAVFLYLMHTLMNHLRSPSLVSEKFETEDVYI